MKIVGLVSSYREGELVRGAVNSLERSRLDDLIIYEGPAGEPIEGAPPSVFFLGDQVKEGRWRSDGRKRDAMLQEAKRRHPEPETWGLWLDGDEILVNGEYLRDILQSRLWNDEADGGEPTIHCPLWIIEADGAMAITTSRIFRLDLVRSIDISSATITNVYGIEEGWGNTTTDARVWIEMWELAVSSGRMMAWPPRPCEPHIYHRSHLRHPARRKHRLHEQETEILKETGRL